MFHKKDIISQIIRSNIQLDKFPIIFFIIKFLTIILPSIINNRLKILMKLLLVGHGSIGSKYKNELVNKRNFPKNNLYIIERNKDIRDSLNLEEIKCFENIEELKSKNLDFYYGIVANWGPEHVKTTNKLLDLGVKRIIIEKPVSNSLKDLNLLIKRCKKLDVFISVHHRWKYLDLGKKILEIQNQLNFGDPVGMRIMGGALCISTGAIHWLDLACEILNSDPISVIADLDIDYINPRDKGLAYIGGCASYRLENKKFIHISYTNSNSQAPRTELVYKHGIIKIDVRGFLKCFQRSQSDLEKYSNKITRYGFLNHLKDFEFENIDTINLVLDDLFLSTLPKVSLERSKKSLLMLIGALQSHSENKKIECSIIKDQDIKFS